MISPHWHPSSDYHRSAFLIGRLHLGMDAKGAKESSLFILFDAGQHCLEIRQVNHFYVPAGHRQLGICRLTESAMG